jgi:hypothetical protein
MLDCAVYSRLSLPGQQVWITAKPEDIPDFLRPPQTIESACDCGVYEAKQSLKELLPPLYVHATKVPSVSSSNQRQSSNRPPFYQVLQFSRLPLI